MPVIGLSGPNAIGKTTAVSRWVHRYQSLWAALADNQRETGADDWDKVLAGPPNVREWKHDGEAKRLLVEKHRAGRVTVIDSARTTALNFFEAGEPIILVVTDGPTLGRLLRARCEDRQKRFRDDYWTADKLDYEARHRYLNFAAKGIGECNVFEIRDQARDWAAVDEYFGRLFRRLHNELNRSK